MHRSLRYLAFTGSGVLSGLLAYKLGAVCQNDVVYGHGADQQHQSCRGEQPEVFRSHLAFANKQTWNQNWDFREPAYDEAVNSPRKSGGGDRVPSFAELSGGESATRSRHSAESSNKSHATRNLVFIRHGQYVNTDKREDKILTNLGRQQAELTGERLVQLNNHKSIDKLVISSMVRAKETGDIIRKSLPEVPYQYCDFLIEGAPCRPEPPSSSWKPDAHEIFEDSARIEAAFRRYFHRADPEQKNDSLEVYVCHANVIRYFVCRALQLPPEAWLRMSIGNCGLTWFKISPSGRVSLYSMGDVGHLPPKMTSLRADKINATKL